MKKKYKIEDWAGNILNFEGKFERPEFSVPMEFKSFDDAVEYGDLVFGNDFLEDLYIEEL